MPIHGCISAYRATRIFNNTVDFGLFGDNQSCKLRHLRIDVTKQTSLRKGGEHYEAT